MHTSTFIGKIYVINYIQREILVLIVLFFVAMHVLKRSGESFYSYLVISQDLCYTVDKLKCRGEDTNGNLFEWDNSIYFVQKRNSKALFYR